jgi:beta-lactamase class A
MSFIKYLLLAVLFVISHPVVFAVSSIQNSPNQDWFDLQKQVQFQIDNFPGQCAILIKDLKKGWTIEYQAELSFPSASLIKIPIMAALYEAWAEGQIHLEEKLSIQKRLKASGSGTLKYEKPGTKITFQKLIYKMITESDNTATNILTDYFGLEYFDQRFKKLGLSKTSFSRMIMDLKKRNQGIENMTTAKDMAYLLEKIYNDQIIGSKEMLSMLKQQKINDRLSATLPSQWEIGHKTGLMKNCCHDVGIIFSPSSDYIVCVLTSGRVPARRAKSFIAEIAYLTSVYYTQPLQKSS